MAKAYKRLRRERTERRVKNQRFIEPSKRPLTGKRKKSLIRTLFSNDQQGLRFADAATRNAARGQVQQMRQYRSLDKHDRPKGDALMQRQDQDAVEDTEKAGNLAPQWGRGIAQAVCEHQWSMVK